MSNHVVVRTLLLLLMACSSAGVLADDSVTERFRRIATNGQVLAIGPQVITLVGEHACTRDLQTGLVWEAKTADGGLRDGHWTYWPHQRSWSQPGVLGYHDASGGKCLRERMEEGSCNTEAYVKAVNASGLCGRSDWRLPSVDELLGIAVVYAGLTATLREQVFPQIVPGWYWSATAEVGGVPFPRVVLLPPGASPLVFDGTYSLLLVSGAAPGPQ